MLVSMCRVVRLLPLVLLLAVSACKVELYGDLDEREANEMIAVLLRSNIPATRELSKDRRATVHVDEGRFGEAVDVLRAQGFPREDFDTLGKVFRKEGLISSPTEERARFIYAMSQELSATVSEIDGVLSARIHVVLPENDPLRTNAAPASASVSIRHDDTINIESLVPQIKLLVANSIEGLVYDKVSVVLFPVNNSVPAVSDLMVTDVAGLWVLRSSETYARAIIGAFIVSVLLAIIALFAAIWFWRRATVMEQAAS